MSNIDPSQPTYGNATTQSVRDNMVRAKAEIEALQALIDAMRADIDDIDTTLAAGPFVPLAGGVPMTGPLVLSGPPSADLGAATKGYVDTHAPAGGPYLALAGGTLVGPLALAADPAQPLEAATRRYVDAHAPRLLTASWVAGVNPNNVNLGVLAQGGTVVSVTGVSELLNGAPATVTPYWVASGGGLGANGTALTTSAFDARAAQGSVQTLPLTGSVVVPPGGRIGLRTTGVFDTSVANITVRVV